MSDDLHQSILRRVLRIRKRPEHPQRQVKYQILHTEDERLQRLFIAGNRLLNQKQPFFVSNMIHTFHLHIQLDKQNAVV